MLVLYFIFLANIFCTSSFHGASFSNFFWAVLAFGRFSNKKFKYLYTFRSYAFVVDHISRLIYINDLTVGKTLREFKAGNSIDDEVFNDILDELNNPKIYI